MVCCHLSSSDSDLISTELAVTYFTDIIGKEVDNGNILGAVFIDLSKAFDTVSHSRLLNKLPSYGINNKELHWFTDYLFSRTQSVQFKGALSDANPIFSGVPQGSILGPLLFTIHFNDVHTPLQSTSIITYTDDTVIFTAVKDLESTVARRGHATYIFISRDKNTVYRAII